MQSLKTLVKALTANDKYSPLNNDNLMLAIQTQLSLRQKKTSKFFFQFWNLAQTLKILKKKITLIADVFLKLRTLKNVIK